MKNGFEVFISFKNTDKNGERTQDSIMAEELYYALKEKAIRAFYSNVSISERGEHRFGKMIREAIEQCSIFVAVGTSIENFESEWVEYERESFHDEMMNGNKPRTRSAMFSYITRNVSTNKLPMELRRCQAFYELKDVVSSICTRFQKENEVIHNFKPQEISIKSLSPGTLVDGKYKILQEIGRGGMSVVYLAMDMRLHREWAVKVVRKEGICNFEVVKQSLLAEIDMLKSFNHPNLPKIVDVIDAKESFVMIMDYIEGYSLSKLIKDGAQPEATVIHWGKQLCDVLHYLHTHNPPIIYRDLKPANIMLKPDGQITLVDFGTARQYKEQNLADTTCLGTVGYAAPEQFGGMGQTDPRTDIYTLGVTLYHLVTGQNPTEPPYELYPIRTINPQLSCGLEYIIGKCIRRNPEERYQSASELRRDLDDINKIDAKYRRKGIVKATINKIFGKKDKSQEKKTIEEKKNERKPPVVPPFIPPVKVGGQAAIPPSISRAEIVDQTSVLPVYSDVDKCDVVKKSTLVNSNTVILCDKVAEAGEQRIRKSESFLSALDSLELIDDDVVSPVADAKFSAKDIAESVSEALMDMPMTEQEKSELRRMQLADTLRKGEAVTISPEGEISDLSTATARENMSEWDVIQVPDGKLAGGHGMCRICGTVFNQMTNYCPTCGTKVVIEKRAVTLDKVQFSAIAPKTFVKGDYSVIEIMMYEETFRHIVQEAIANVDPPVKETKSGVLTTEKEAKITVMLSSPDIDIEDNIESQIWQGDYLNFSFAVEVPGQYTKRQILFVASVYINDIIATKLKFVA